jgi:hypothetical protein
MLGQGVAVSLLAELAQETRRPLDIGKDKRDRARRLLSHGGIFRRHESRCNQRRYLMSVSILNIGRYIAITMVPTMIPTPIIRIGSMMDVRDLMLVSTSSS